MSGAVVRRVEKVEKGIYFSYFGFLGLLRAQLVTLCCLTSWNQTIVGYLVLFCHLFLSPFLGLSASAAFKKR